eukprot:g5637.t1
MALRRSAPGRRQVAWIFESFDVPILEQQSKRVQKLLEGWCRTQPWQGGPKVGATVAGDVNDAAGGEAEASAGGAPWVQQKDPSYVYLPTKKKRWTVLRSPFVNKSHREQFEFQMHRRGVYLTFDPATGTDAAKSEEELDAWFQEHVEQSLEGAMKEIKAALPAQMSGRMRIKQKA